ncbi:MAG: hypothetical protein Q8L30_00175 [bacterium]|nr:hypothetical protein [bacterium]
MRNTTPKRQLRNFARRRSRRASLYNSTIRDTIPRRSLKQSASADLEPYKESRMRKFAIWALVALLSPTVANATIVNVSRPAPYGWFWTYALFWTVSVVLVTLRVWAVRNGNYYPTTADAVVGFALGITILAAIGITIFAATVLPAFVALVSAYVPLLVLAALTAVLPAKKRHFFFFSGIYGACMMVSMVGFILS